MGKSILSAALPLAALITATTASAAESLTCVGNIHKRYSDEILKRGISLDLEYKCEVFGDDCEIIVDGARYKGFNSDNPELGDRILSYQVNGSSGPIYNLDTYTLNMKWNEGEYYQGQCK